MTYRQFFNLVAKIIVGSTTLYLLFAIFSLQDGISKHSTFLYGDFVSFYTAGLILLKGHAHRLYEWSYQEQLQNELLGLFDGLYLPFAYPPYVAQLLTPLVYLPLFWARLVWVLAMVLCVVLMFRIVNKHFTITSSMSALEVCALFIVLHPIGISVYGGQNTALSMLLLALLLHAARSGHYTSRLYPGASLGMWLFKPHFPIVLLPALMVAHATRMFVVFIIIGLLLWALAATQFGYAWFIDWIEVCKEFSQLESEYNNHNLISLPAYLSHSAGVYVGDTQIPSLLLLGTTSLGFLLTGYVLFSFRRCIRSDASAFELSLCFSVVGGLLFSPHAMYYDIGLGVLAAFWALQKYLVFKNRYYVIFLIMCIACWQLSVSILGCNSLTLFLICVGFHIYRELQALAQQGCTEEVM